MTDIHSKIQEAVQKLQIVDSRAVKILTDVLSQSEVVTALEKAESDRKNKIMIWSLVSGIVSVGILCFFGFFADTIFMGVLPLIVVNLILAGIFLHLLKGKAATHVKELVIGGILQGIIPDSKFSPSQTYAFPFAPLVDAKFINSYDQVDGVEDTMEFEYAKDGKRLQIRGLELKTSEMQGSGKERKRVVTNECYLMRGEYPETRVNITENILIKRDVADSAFLKILFFIIPAIIGYVFLTGENNSGIVFMEHGLNAGLLAGAFGSVAGCIILQFVNYNRVKLENVAFEKLFDVTCNDQILSRIILTPAFMDRLVQFVQKSLGSYEFLFDKNTIYIKKDLQNSSGFMEIAPWKSMGENIEGFVQWYAEINELVSLVADTGVLVYSKTGEL